MYEDLWQNYAPYTCHVIIQLFFVNANGKNWSTLPEIYHSNSCLRTFDIIWLNQAGNISPKLSQENSTHSDKKCATSQPRHRVAFPSSAHAVLRMSCSYTTAQTSSGLPVHLLLLNTYFCYTPTFAIHLLLHFCYTPTFAIHLLLIYTYFCYTPRFAIHLLLLHTSFCYTPTFATPTFAIHLLLLHLLFATPTYFFNCYFSPINKKKIRCWSKIQVNLMY